MENKKLTEKIEIGSVTEDALIHIVEPNDTSQGPSGSSYKFKIKNLVLAGQDNIDIKKYVTILASDNLTQILDKINLLAPYTVDEKQSVWFVTRQKPGFSPFSPYAPQRVLKYKMMNKGKGTYGEGEIQLTTSDIELIYSNVESAADLEEDPTTDIINIGDIPDMPISEWLNFQDPAIVIQSQEDGYTIFQGTIDAESVTYLWIGEPGVYGIDETQATEADFQLLSSSLPPMGVISVTGNAVNNSDPENPEINIADGLRYEDDVIKLGSVYQAMSTEGHLTEDTSIVRANNPEQGLVTSDYFDNIDHTGTIGRLQKSDGAMAMAEGVVYTATIDNRVGYLDSVLCAIATLGITIDEVPAVVTIGPQGMIFEDGIWQTGAKYADKYHDNYTERSLPDVEFVNNTVAAQPSFVTINSGDTDTSTLQDDRLIGAATIAAIASSSGMDTDPYNSGSWPGLDLDSNTGTITITDPFFYAYTNFMIFFTK